MLSPGPPVDVNRHPVSWFMMFCRFCEIALEGLKTHKVVHLLVVKTVVTGSNPGCPSRGYHVPVR